MNEAKMKIAEIDFFSALNILYVIAEIILERFTYLLEWD